MMAAHEEEAAIERALALARVRQLCSAWAYWCNRSNIQTGYENTMSTGGVERGYMRTWQYDTPEPRLPEADENVGMAVQRAYVRLPESPYRKILRAEFHFKPFVIPIHEGEQEQAAARRARVSLGAYVLTLNRAMLALRNQMKRLGTWREA